MTSMVLPSLTDAGLQAFRDVLDSVRGGADPTSARALLSVDENVRPLPKPIKLDDRSFENKRQLGRYLLDRLADLDPTWLGPQQGVWAALAVFYLRHLCPTSSTGRPQPGKNHYYIPSDDFRSDYRHKVRTPYYLTRRFGDRANILLDVSVDTHGDMLEQLGSKLKIITNSVVIEVADRLYYDFVSGCTKRGATDREKGGTVRRLLTVLRHYERTYDLYSINSKELLELLPVEFDRWRETAA